MLKRDPMVKIQADFFVKELENDEECFLFLKKILNGSRDIGVFRFSRVHILVNL